MKPTEFRIGNLLQEKYTGEIISVIELTKDKITFTGSFTEKWQAEPIPLTEDWLLKLKFIKGRNVLFLPIPMMGCEIHAALFHGQYIIELLNSVKAIITEVKYVHQLQNLFHSLTGEELEVKNES